MKLRIAITLVFLLHTFFVFAVEFPPRPSPPRLVNDFTNTLTPNEIQALEDKLVEFDDSSSIQIAVVMLRSLDGYPISEYAFELGEKWGVGQAKTDNGVLVLVALNDRLMYIATGYGLEGALPDALCKRIIDNDIRPFFKEGNYYKGLQEGTSQLIALSRGEYKDTMRSRSSRFNDVSPVTAIIIVMLIFALIFFFKIRSVGQYARLNSIPFWTAWALLNAATGRQSGNWTNFNRGGGIFGGSSGWSGGSSGGGFGGFGGGSFGGGGAGGSW